MRAVITVDMLPGQRLMLQICSTKYLYRIKFNLVLPKVAATIAPRISEVNQG